MFKNKKNILVILFLVFALVFISTACSGESEPAPAPVAPADVAAPVQEINEDAVLLQAAKDYFDYLPANSNMIVVDPEKSDFVANLDKYYVIDIRSEEAYAEGHIPGSVNIPFKEMGAAIDTLPTDEVIVTVCYTGRTGNQASSVLKMAGFDAIALRGGYEEWVNADLPIEK